MRYINIEDLAVPKEWKLQAARALAQVKELPPNERSRAIQERASIWQKLKDALKELSHGKCWYCESDRHRADDAVDHFRPKGAVAGCQDHDGYWWLAFDWENYRFACTFCNSRRTDRVTGATGGKQDNFPLLPGGVRATCEEDHLEREQPCLLDPARATDPGLLWFTVEGQVTPRYSEDENCRFHQRAAESIELYHLNYHETQERRVMLYQQIKRLVADGNNYFDDFANGNYVAEHALNRVMQDLIRLTRPSAEFSAAAKAYLMGFRSSHRNWIETLIYTS